MPVSPGSKPVVSCRDLQKVYGSGPAAVVAVDGVCVDFAAGQFTAIMGPSGSGKTTLMHLLAGLDYPSSGHVLVDGHDLSALDDRALTDLRRDRIGFIFQAFNLLPTLTAEQNIVLASKLAGRGIDQDRVRTVAASLGLSDRMAHRPSELSGGQQQRVAVARALLMRPAVIFADEPTGALDSAAGRGLLSGLRTAAREEGQTIVMVTHDPIAAAYTDRVLLMTDGRIRDELASPTWESIVSAISGVEV